MRIAMARLRIAFMPHRIVLLMGGKPGTIMHHQTDTDDQEDEADPEQIR
jgi:hypothetical protein